MIHTATQHPQDIGVHTNVDHSRLSLPVSTINESVVKLTWIENWSNRHMQYQSHDSLVVVVIL